MMKFVIPATAGAVMACVGTANAGLTTVAEFEIQDHPSSGLLPPPYALRLDEVFGQNSATYSAATFSDATLTVLQDAGGAFMIDIAGTFHGGQDNGAGWTNEHDLSVSMRYAANVVELANGWQVNGFTTLNSGTFTRMDTNESVTLFGMESMSVSDGPLGSTFVLASDGWRIDGDDSTWVGRGWLTPNTDGTPIGEPAQDWLFTATLVPAPGAAALLGMGGLIATRRRR